MSSITRTTTSRPAPARRRLLLVRPPVRSVRPHEHAERAPFRVALGTLVGAGTLLLVWLLGHVGFRLGFAPLVLIPQLGDHPLGGLATGTLMLLSVPRTIFQAGIAQPMWLMLAFAMVALPAAPIAAARPRVPGGPALPPGIAALAAAGAAAAVLSAALVIWWAGSSARMSLLGALPLDAASATRWHESLQTAAGLDVFAVVSTALWVVLVMRLPIPAWLRAIAASGTLFTLAVAVVAMATSSAAAALAGSARSLAEIAGGGETRLVVGSTPDHVVTLSVQDGRPQVDLVPTDVPFTVVGRRSIVAYLAERAPAEE
jgi:hypothetical protein